MKVGVAWDVIKAATGLTEANFQALKANNYRTLILDASCQQQDPDRRQSLAFSTSVRGKPTVAGFSWGSLLSSDLRGAEGARIAYGRAQFGALSVGKSPACYEVATSVAELLAGTDAGWSPEKGAILKKSLDLLLICDIGVRNTYP